MSVSSYSAQKQSKFKNGGWQHNCVTKRHTHVTSLDQPSSEIHDCVFRHVHANVVPSQYDWLYSHVLEHVPICNPFLSFFLLFFFL